jgi:hypothetical protein
MARAGEEDSGIRKANSQGAPPLPDRPRVVRRRAQPTSLPDEIRAAQ